MQKSIALLLLFVFILLTPPNGEAAFGDPDPSFGGIGEISFYSGPTSATVYALTRQSDGKIVAVGAHDDVYDDDRHLLVRRFNVDGSPDLSFGNAGTARPQFALGVGRLVAIQTDGKILVIGSGGTSANDQNSYIWRFNTNGNWDQTFGTGGRVLIGTSCAGFAAVKTSASSNVNSIYYICGSTMGRLNSNGSPNTAFGGGDGSVSVSGQLFVGINATLVTNPSLVVAHTYFGMVILTGYLADGSINTSFGSGGTAITSYGSYSNYSLGRFQRTSQGRFLLSGWYCVPPGCTFVPGLVSSHSANGTYENSTSVGQTFMPPLASNSAGEVFSHSTQSGLLKMSDNLQLLENTWGPACTSMITQPDGKVLCSVDNSIYRFMQ